MKRVYSAAVAIAVVAALGTGSAHGQEQKAVETKSAPGAEIRFPVEKYKLANGLTVLLHEDHSAPIVSYQTWFRVGSKNEKPGTTGIAHLFEHMMFKGAKRYSGDQFWKLLEANGATNNAFTSNDYTGYYENLPSAKLELAIDIESDRMENLQITPGHLQSEREVVKEERRYRVDNNPMGLLYEALFATVFKVSPYRWPVIGYMNDLDNVTLEKANEFYRTFYAPNNAVIVVAGDFQSVEVKKLIEKYYGQLKAQPLPTEPLPVEPPQKAQRIQILSRDVQSPVLTISYLAPKAGTDEAYALDLLANVLGRGTSSRLHKRLVYRDQVATSASVYNMTLQDAGLFGIFITLKPGANWDSVQRSIFGEMWRPRNVQLSAAELEMAKNQVMKGFIDGLKTVHGKASALATNEILFGDYEQLFKDLARYEKVTAPEVLAAAKKYLVPSNSSLVVLKPAPAGAKNAATPSTAPVKPAPAITPQPAPSPAQGGNQ